MKLVFSLILIYLIYRIYCFIRLVVKRCIAVKQLKKLGNEKNVKIKFTRSVFSTLFGMSSLPDVCAEVGDKIYLMRFYNGRGKKTQAHFANEEYSVIYSIMLFQAVFSLRARTRINSMSQVRNVSTFRRKVKIVPKLEIPAEYRNAEEYGKSVIPVLVFNPTPSEVTYVSDEKTSIKLAFTGDEFRGIKIFTGSTVVNFLEREGRYLDVRDDDFSRFNS